MYTRTFSHAAAYLSIGFLSNASCFSSKGIIAECHYDLSVRLLVIMAKQNMRFLERKIHRMRPLTPSLLRLGAKGPKTAAYLQKPPGEYASHARLKTSLDQTRSLSMARANLKRTPPAAAPSSLFGSPASPDRTEIPTNAAGINTS